MLAAVPPASGGIFVIISGLYFSTPTRQAGKYGKLTPIPFNGRAVAQPVEARAAARRCSPVPVGEVARRQMAGQSAYVCLWRPPR